MPSNIRTITSLQNPQVKNLVKLRGRRARNAQGLQIIEEPLVIRRAMAGGIVFRTVFFCPEQLTDPAAETLLADLRQSPPPSLEFVRLTPRLMTKVSYRAHPAGLLVLAQQTRRQLTDLKLSSRPLLVVLVGVRKPGNLGAILRIADGAGADAVISCVPGPDPSNPNVMRTSRGTCFTLPMTIAPKEEIETFLAAHGIRRVATSPVAERIFTECELVGPVAIILGAEDLGLDSTWLAEADQMVRIPMQGLADSLNVATTAALMLYEAVRQRRD